MLTAFALPALSVLAAISPLEACHDAIAAMRADAADVCEQMATHKQVSREDRLRARELLVQAHSLAGEVDIAVDVAAARLLLDPLPLDEEALDEGALALFARARARVDATPPPITLTHAQPAAPARASAQRPTLTVTIDDRAGLVARVELWVQAKRHDGVELVSRRPIRFDGEQATGVLVDPLPATTSHDLTYRVALLTDDGLVLESEVAKLVVELGAQQPDSPAPVVKTHLPWQMSLASDVSLASMVIASLGAGVGVVGAAVAIAALLPLAAGGVLPLGLLLTGTAGMAGGLLVGALGSLGLAGAWGLRQWGEGQWGEEQDGEDQAGEEQDGGNQAGEEQGGDEHGGEKT